MRGRSLRPFIVEVCCMRQSPPTRGRSLRPLVVKVRCTRHVLQQGADHWDPWWLKSVEWDNVLQWGADHCGPHCRSPLHKTKSSNEGQIIETLVGQSPLNKTKSSNKGHLLRPHGQWQKPTRGVFEALWPMRNLSALVSIIVCLVHPISHILLLVIFGYNIWCSHIISTSAPSTAWVLLPPTTPNSTVKHGNLASSPEQAYNLLPPKYFDHILGGIGADTIATLGTVAPGSYNLSYIYVPLFIPTSAETS